MATSACWRVAMCLIAISNSGETQEILQLLPFMERMGIPVVAIVGRNEFDAGQEQ